MASSCYFQLVERFAADLARAQGQQIARLPGDPKRVGWRTYGKPGAPDILIHWKRAGLSANDRPPRIVCVADGADFGNVDQPGGRGIGLARVNALDVRLFRIQCYCWGQDDGQSEELYLNAVRAWHHLHSDSDQPGKRPVFRDERWEDEQPNAGGQGTHGAMISFGVMFELVVPSLPDQLTIVETIDQDLYFERAPDDTRPLEVTNVTITS